MNVTQAKLASQQALTRTQKMRKVERRLNRILKNIEKRANKGYCNYTYSFLLFTPDPVVDVIRLELIKRGFIVHGVRNFNIKW